MASSKRTALITGASSGLGAEFACQLAANGYDLVLTARREDRLQQLAESLQTRYPISLTIFPADLSNLTDIEQLASTISNLPQLDLLVNNAGFGTVGRFYRVDPAKELAMLNVHITASVMLSRAALPGMLSCNQGGIINVSSMAGLVPIRNVLYHSTKAFLISFSEVLSNELRGTGVCVQALCPGFTITEFHDTPEYTRFTRRSIPRFLWLTSKQVVAESLTSLPTGKLVCIPGTVYKIGGAFARNSFSAGIIKYIAGLIINKPKAL
ncbi:MAG: NAD(P)-dependent oxidoreductase [Anaerolineales bacterium]|nr:SDR family oxidoreductase [Anaerolineae bacterium]PWB52348.1 MAG: NAD(P)-dependent oxidoreductase [Anaerolineales bacterium]